MRTIKFKAFFSSKQNSPNEWSHFTLEEIIQWAGLSEWTHWHESTGLFDKNGIEIYEGDIILCGDSNKEHEEFKTKVWFNEGKFVTTYLGLPVFLWCARGNLWCEVIGNIFSNPELLDEKI